MNRFEDIFAIVGIALYLFCFFLFSGNFSGGFQIIDGHDDLEIHHNIQEKGFAPALKSEMNSRLKVRFLPVYSFMRTIKVLLLQDNWKAYAMYNFLLSLSTCIAFFVFARLLKYSVPAALIFVFFIFFGSESWFNQATIFFRVACAELPGMLVLGLSLIAMVLSVRAKKLWNRWEVVFLLLTILNTMIKESFIIIIPALVSWKIWYYSEHKQLDLWTSFKKHVPFGLVLGSVLAIEIFILLFVIGTDKMGYVGVSAESSLLANIISVSKKMISDSAVSLTIYAIIVSSALISSTLPESWWKSIKEYVLRYWVHFTLAIMIVLPQIVLYNKGAGMYERYKLPFMLGVGFLLLVFSDVVFKSSQRYAVLKLLFIMPFILFGYRNSVNAYANAVAYAHQSHLAETVLSKIQLGRGEKIMILADPVLNFEWSISMQKYLAITGNLPEARIKAISLGQNDKLTLSKDPKYQQQLASIHQEMAGLNYWQESFAAPQYVLIADTAMVNAYLMNQSWFMNNYNREEIGDMTLFSRHP
ncbi:MAG: hypothetical protein SFW35_09145 [Chitinophagales bacterium]|nr:hypothetical protein [Chitinophagales bacterium]